jgi:polyphosphate kinase
MRRNLLGRVETCFPVRDPGLFERIYSEGLEVYLRDNRGAFNLLPDGNYRAVTPGKDEQAFSAQEWLMQAYSS